MDDYPQNNLAVVKTAWKIQNSSGQPVALCYDGIAIPEMQNTVLGSSGMGSISPKYDDMIFPLALKETFFFYPVTWFE